MQTSSPDEGPTRAPAILQRPASSADRLTDLLRILACTSFGLGYARGAPGTIGTLPAVVIFVLVSTAWPGGFGTALLLLFFVAACVLSIALGEWAERYWQKKDPGHFVLDEVAGFFLTVLLYQGPSLFWTTLWAFLATRAFDIIKPPPAAQAQRLRAGWGILLDDLFASLYAAVFLHLAGWLLPGIF